MTAAPLNTVLVSRLQHGDHVELAGSIYALRAADRLALAQHLGEREICVHADVFAQPAPVRSTCTCSRRER